MKITIDLENFFLDEDQNLEEGLKNYVTREVLSTIWKSIEGQVKNQIEFQIKVEAEKKIADRVSETITEIIAKGETTYNREVMTFEKMIEVMFHNNSTYNSVNDRVASISKATAEEIKRRYDLSFASQLVAKMKELGLVNDGVAQTLISSTT